MSEPTEREPITHDLKCWPIYFQQIKDGTKTFEARRYDRDFVTGDILALLEYVPETNEYTGRAVYRRVTCIIYGPSFGIESGFCVMAIPSPDWQDKARIADDKLSEAREVIKQAEEALTNCYDVTEWPANGTGSQAEALDRARKWLEANK